MTIGGPESTPGSAEARTAQIPHRSVPTLKKMAEKNDDPVVTGRNMKKGTLVTSENVAGDIQLSPRPCAGMGMLFNSLLGQESTPQQVLGCIRFKYTGSSASAKISVASNTITSEIGAYGSESGDPNFGDYGDIDTSQAAYDTIGELVTVIDGYTDYSCEKLFGEDADLLTAGVVDISEAQGNDRWVYIWIKSAASGIYLHTWNVDLTNTQRPVYSVQIDNIHDNYLYTAIVADRLNLTAALKSFLEGTISVMGFDETGSQSGSSVNLENQNPFLFSDGGFFLDGTKYLFNRNVSVEMNNNHNPDGYGQGAITRAYQEKGMFSASGSVQMRHEASVFAQRAKVFSNAVVGIDLLFEYDSFVGTLPSELIVQMPYCQLSNYEPTENRDVIDAKVDYEVVYPEETYGSPLTVFMITDDSSAY